MIIRHRPQESETQEYMADLDHGAECEYELTQTDYIIIKISEAIADGDIDEAERIRREHADTIARRKALRKMINDIKAKWEH